MIYHDEYQTITKKELADTQEMIRRKMKELYEEEKAGRKKG